MMEINYFVIAVYCFLAVLWFLFVMKAKSAKNYMLFISWTIFFPFTFVLFTYGAMYVVFIEEFIEWLKKDF